MTGDLEPCEHMCPHCGQCRECCPGHEPEGQEYDYPPAQLGQAAGSGNGDGRPDHR